MDHKANPGDFYGPSGEVWNGFTDSLIPDDIQFDETNLKINWEGCEKAVGPFKL